MNDRAEAPLSLAERGRTKDGQPLALDRRLFFQLLVFRGATSVAALVRALQDARLECVLYEDLQDPRGVGLLTFAEDPAHFAGAVREVVNAGPFGALEVQRAMSMIGRTYSIGYEHDLEDTLLERPRARVLDPAWPWAVWYPLRRSGAFERLGPAEQREALMEHGALGRRFGEAGAAVDIRLASHGLDTNDNDFMIGLLGPQLHALSALVQAMRRTVQTSVYVERMGPFFVGRAIHRSGSPSRAVGEPA